MPDRRRPGSEHPSSGLHPCQSGSPSSPSTSPSWRAARLSPRPDVVPPGGGGRRRPRHEPDRRASRLRQGVPVDHAEARRWYDRALAKDVAAAYTAIGMQYDHAMGVPRDPAKAFDWYKQGAAHGAAASMNNLGFAYEKGRGVAKNLQEAVRWYEAAVNKDDRTAQLNLANLYLDGRGVAKDPIRGLRLLRSRQVGRRVMLGSSTDARQSRRVGSCGTRALTMVASGRSDMVSHFTHVVAVVAGSAALAWVGPASAQRLTGPARDFARAKLVEGCLKEAREGGDVKGLDTPSLCGCSADEVLKRATAADLDADESPRMEAIIKAAGQICVRRQSPIGPGASPGADRAPSRGSPSSASATPFQSPGRADPSEPRSPRRPRTEPPRPDRSRPPHTPQQHARADRPRSACSSVSVPSPTP